MFCAKCGEQVTNGNRFCQKCGTEIMSDNLTQANDKLNFNVCISSIIGAIITILMTGFVRYFSNLDNVLTDSIYVTFNFYVAIVFILAIGTIVRYVVNKKINTNTKIFACTAECLAVVISCIILAIN